MTDVAHDGAVFHLAHMVDGDDVEVTRRGHEDVRTRGGVFHGGDFVALHGGLQGADRVDLGHHDAAAGLAQRGGRTFADVSEPRHHSVGAAADAVDERFATAIEVVEFRFGYAVIDVDRGP